MKNQFISRIVKFTFAFMFILIASSCNEDNDAMDAAALAKDQINSEIAAKGSKVVATVTFTSFITGNELDVCVDAEQTFTLSGWKDGAQLNVKIYDEDLADWVSIDSFTGQLTSPQSLSYTFPAIGVYLLKYQVSGSAANGGTNGFVEFTANVVECDGQPCTESAPDTAYAGDSAGATVTGPGGNNAWWYFLDIGDGSSNVTENIWKGKTTDIGDVTYNATTNMITIILDDWFIETSNSDSVKWYSYADGALPTDGRPTPGQAPNKGTSLSFLASTDRYYAIHLDVATCE